MKQEKKHLRCLVMYTHKTVSDMLYGEDTTVFFPREDSKIKARSYSI